MTETGVGRSVLVQTLNNLGETLWFLEIAGAHPWIAGVVGWLDLAEPPERLEAALADLARNPKLVALRHLVEFEADDDWLLRPQVVAGLRVLEKREIAYDLLLKPRHLKRVPALSEQLPGLRMVIDHIAKPDIANGVRDPWQADLAAAAQNPRLYCKLSGMVTEADHAAWKPADLVPYVEAALRAFGVERLMFGSDWPVCTLAGSYGQVHSALRQALDQILGGLDEATERAVFRDNAIRFYRLPEAD
jgi:L-fuconolactonase